MDIKINALQLKKCIEPCNYLVGKLDKGFDLKYANIQIIIKNKVLELYASDTNINIYAKYGDVSEATSDIDVSVPASHFFIIFSDITDSNDVVTFQFKNKFLKVLYKKQQYTLSYFYHAELVETNKVDSKEETEISIVDNPQAFQLHNNLMFQDIDKNEHVSVLTCNYTELKKIFSNLMPCMSKSPAESHIFGIYYDGNFYASNGSSFTGSYDTNNKFDCGEVSHLFFQKGILEYLLKINIDDECSIGLRGRMVSIKVGHLQIAFRNNLVKYVPIQVLKSFITKNNYKCIVKTKDLLPIVKKVRSFADFVNRSYGEIIFTKEGNLTITVKDTNKKSSFVEYNPDEPIMTENNVEVGILLDNVFDALEEIDTEDTIIHYNDSQKIPLIFMNENGKQFYYISPVKVGIKNE